MTQPFRLMRFNPQWQQEFEQSRSSILSASMGLISKITHIGGTALDGKTARPVIDMLATMADLRELNEACEAIEGLNFSRVETPTWCDQELCAYLLKPRTGEATHSILVCKEDSYAWQRANAIQNHLCGNAQDAHALEQLKLEMYQPHCSAEVEYAQAKSAFFEDLYRRVG